MILPPLVFPGLTLAEGRMLKGVKSTAIDIFIITMKIFTHHVEKS